MKLNRILSSALTVVMIFMTLAAVLPVQASAAYSGNVQTVEQKTNEQIQEIVKEAMKTNYATDEEMLKADLDRGYLDSVSNADGKFTIYVNRYTGVMYYRNNMSGQIITSNPVDVYANSNNSEASAALLLSQIYFRLFEISNPTNEYKYDSTTWSALYSQISVSAIANGLRVNYTIGDTAARFLLPGWIEHDSFVENILSPLLEEYESRLNEYCSNNGQYTFNFIEDEDNWADGCISTRKLRNYLTENKNKFKSLESSNPQMYSEINSMHNSLLNMFSNTDGYALKNPAAYQGEGYEETLNTMYTLYPCTKEGMSIFVLNASQNEAKRNLSKFLTKYCQKYTFAMMYEDERKCGYVDDSEQKPVLRCALEYSFKEDGSLEIRLPAGSINFDESVYALDYIVPLRYLGAADMNNDGYVFYPDGSGTVIEYDDFYDKAHGITNNISFTSSIYGLDFCYSSFEAKDAYKNQITMPVYGLINDRPVNATIAEKTGVSVGSLQTMGYFAIIEEGASLAKLELSAEGSSNKFINVSVQYEPVPADTFDLSASISVGSLGDYTIVSDSKYTGSFVTRIVMLSDATVGSTLQDGSYYEASYAGMANYYRNYLYENGVLDEVKKVSENIPLYIEALGSMSISAKFLSFPITKKIALTTFDDIALMYEQLSTAKSDAYETYEARKAKAEAETDETLKAQYESERDAYYALYLAYTDITNINFKLTGFANGGMYSTYPAKLKWERVVGGRSGFRDLLDIANEESEKAGVNFGIYPDFDFMYIENTEAFDGITKKGNVSRMIDNRYSTRQTYNMLMQAYETDQALVVSPDVLSKFFDKFNRKYSRYDTHSVSVSTLGSALNSNFDEKNSIIREDAISYVESTLASMSESYSVMIETGNIYAVKYAEHILNVAIDASHFRYSSYAVPFLGMVLHGSVNYSGSALNYTGSPAYDILRSIENGASPYYILCYQDATTYMKEDELLSDYYSVDYHTWFEDVVKNYTMINNILGGLQDFLITGHTTLIGERVIDEEESQANYVLLKNELIDEVHTQIAEAIQAKFEELRIAGTDSSVGFTLAVDKTALLLQFADILNLTVEELNADTAFIAALDAEIAYFTSEYNIAGTDPETLTFDAIEHNSAYRFITDSSALDEDYVFTDYTCDNGKVVMVTYTKGEEAYSYILNYNIYDVTVVLDGKEYSVAKHGFVPVD